MKPGCRLLEESRDRHEELTPEERDAYLALGEDLQQLLSHNQEAPDPGRQRPCHSPRDGRRSVWRACDIGVWSSTRSCTSVRWSGDVAGEQAAAPGTDRLRSAWSVVVVSVMSWHLRFAKSCARPNSRSKGAKPPGAPCANSKPAPPTSRIARSPIAATHADVRRPIRSIGERPVAGTLRWCRERPGCPVRSRPMTRRRTLAPWTSDPPGRRIVPFARRPDRR